MTTLLNYISSFWMVVVMNCIQPVNWKNCYPIDTWLIPDIKKGIEIYLNPSSIYQSERELLENINNGKKK